MYRPPQPLFHEAIHVFAPVNECTPVLVPILQSIGIPKHDKAALRSCQGNIHPPPIAQKSDPSLTIGPNCRKDYQVTLPALVSAAQESTSVISLARQHVLKSIKTGAKHEDSLY
jgi:hypothetical protein